MNVYRVSRLVYLVDLLIGWHELLRIISVGTILTDWTKLLTSEIGSVDKGIRIYRWLVSSFTFPLGWQRLYQSGPEDCAGF